MSQAPLNLHPDRVTIRLPAELDEVAVAAFLDAARQAAGHRRPVEIDCAEADFLSTGAIQVVVALHRCGRENGFPVSLRHVTEAAARYLRLAGFGEFLPG